MNLQRMIRTLLKIVSVIGILLLTGCWDRTEVNDLGLITGVAIDRVNSNQIELSLQIFTPRLSIGGTGEIGKAGIGSDNAMVYSSKGTNIAEALSHLQEKMSRKLFWGHTEVFIFGESEAKHGISDDIDFFIRAPQPRESAYIYVSEGKAQEALEMHAILERNTSEAYRELAKKKTAMSVTLIELMQMINSDSNSAALPWIKKNSQETMQSTTISYRVGTAVFKGDRMVTVLGESSTRGVLWLRNEIQNAVLTVTPDGADGPVSVRLLKSKTTLKPHIEGNDWSVTVRINTSSYAVQNASSKYLMKSEAIDHQVEEALNTYIEHRVLDALRRVQIGLDIDIFDFAGEFRRAFPKEWHRKRYQWDAIYPKINVKIETYSELLRPGLSDMNPKHQRVMTQ
ncbi:Ger(x)C family spore germination protein [Paenibacillus sp. MWE-103]|uniref:Ger(X)C family spore germination protein n=1 Tax=Paenibacillus artemisiicola TaxID=1172618 RepID=A0ABS3WBQ2_9BACL|nr:Ger(x)C family spore germination protein [Paenibacillus artemisiicola]MBO7745740.1 Ger(x)C family spore germination protein [Paenibacillus artemisiicola]